MNSLFRNCIYQGKNIFRDWSFFFWNLLYPIILVTFFYTAFSGIGNGKIENINVGIEKGNPIEYVLETVDIVNVIKISQDEVEESLKDKEIDGFIDKDLNILVNSSGINQTIIKEIVEQTKQMNALNKPIENYEFTVDYIEGKDQKSNGLLIIFYSLIAMVSTYGVFAGIETVVLVQANLTNIGARINLTPLKKKNFLLAGVIVALGFNLMSNGALLLFLKFALKMDLFTELKYSLIFIVLGNLFGVALGIFIGASNKQSPSTKTMISIGITLFLSFLSGMMSTDIKNILDKHVPILGKINPIAIVSNNLYRINLLENTKGVGMGIFMLALYSVVLIMASYVFLRRRNYDSI